MTLELREVWWCWSLTLWHIKVMVSWSVDADVLEPSSPELIAPSPPPQTEPEPMQVDAAPVANDDSVEPQRMQRKLVSKTYVNEEGYMGQYWLVSSTVAAGFAVCLSVFCRMMLCIAWTLLLIDVCLSVTLWHCIKTTEHLAELFCFYTGKADMPTFLSFDRILPLLDIFLSSSARIIKNSTFLVTKSTLSSSKCAKICGRPGLHSRPSCWLMALPRGGTPSIDRFCSVLRCGALWLTVTSAPHISFLAYLHLLTLSIFLRHLRHLGLISFSRLKGWYVWKGSVD